jgi:hypothetical protein
MMFDESKRVRPSGDVFYRFQFLCEPRMEVFSLDNKLIN